MPRSVLLPGPSLNDSPTLLIELLPLLPSSPVWLCLPHVLVKPGPSLTVLLNRSTVLANPPRPTKSRFRQRHVRLPKGPILAISRQLVLVLLLRLPVLPIPLCRRTVALLLGPRVSMVLTLLTALPHRPTPSNVLVCTRWVLTKLLPKVTVPARRVTATRLLLRFPWVPFNRQRVIVPFPLTVTVPSVVLLTVPQLLRTKYIPVNARNAPAIRGLTTVTPLSSLWVPLALFARTQSRSRQFTALKLLLTVRVLAKYPIVQLGCFTCRVCRLLHPKTLNSPWLPPRPLSLGALDPLEKKDPKKPGTTTRRPRAHS